MGEQTDHFGACFIYTLNLFQSFPHAHETVCLFVRNDKLNIMMVRYDHSGMISENTVMTKEEGRALWEKLVSEGWVPVTDENGKTVATPSSHTYFATSHHAAFTYNKQSNDNGTNYALMA